MTAWFSVVEPEFLKHSVVEQFVRLKWSNLMSFVLHNTISVLNSPPPSPQVRPYIQFTRRSVSQLYPGFLESCHFSSECNTEKVSSKVLLSLSHSVATDHRAIGVASSGSEAVLRYLSGVAADYVMLIIPCF